VSRKSSISRLDPRIREAVDAAIREGRATIEDVVLLIRAMGADVSRSAVGRYKLRAEAQMQKYREAQEVAKVWIGKLQAEPDGDVGRLLAEMLRTTAYQTLGDLEAGTPQDVMFLAKALQSLASTDKLTADRILAVRRDVAKEAGKKIEAAEGEIKSGKRTLDLDALKRIREEIYGIA